MLTGGAVAGAVSALHTLQDPFSAARLLDIADDSDLDARLVGGPRRLRFRRDELLLDLLVHDAGGSDGLQILVRLVPPGRFLVRAATRGRGLTVEAAAGARSDAGGVARLTGLPHGITSLRLDGHVAGLPSRTAWVRL